MLLHVLGIVSGLAVAVFAALEPGRARTAPIFFAALVAASVVIGPTRVPDPVWAALVAVTGAAVALWKPRWAWAAVGCGGVMAAVWAAVLTAQGLPMPVAYVPVVALAAASAGLAMRRPGFAPPRLRDEALVLVAALALMLAASPAIVAGWDSAAALRAAPLGRPAFDSAAWAFVLAGVAVLFGVIHSLWRGRR